MLCICTNGRLSDMCPADRRAAGLRFYQRELNAFAADYTNGVVTPADIERAEKLSDEWGSLLNRDARCLTAP